jgi:hypothetical protein
LQSLYVGAQRSSAMSSRVKFIAWSGVILSSIQAPAKLRLSWPGIWKSPLEVARFGKVDQGRVHLMRANLLKPAATPATG